MIQDVPVPVTTRLDGTRDSAEQAVHTPNDDEERLEQMSHPKKQGDGTDDAPRKVEWTCLGLHTEWLWKGLARCGGADVSAVTVFPQTQRVRLVRLSLFGCDPTTSISSPGKSQGQAMENLRERTNRQLLRQPSKKYSTSRCFAQRSSRARGLIRGWIQTAWLQTVLKNWVSPKKSHQRSQSTGCVPVRKAPTNPHSQASASQVKDRWGIRQLTEAGCQCPVHLVRL